MTTLWKTDEELFTIARKELFTALVGDVLDKMGYLHQFLPPHIKPLRADMVVIGRAMPVLEADVFAERQENGQLEVMKKPFGIMFEALDQLQPGEVYICSGSSPRYALWGGLMSTRAIAIGAAGAVVEAPMPRTKVLAARSSTIVCLLSSAAFLYGQAISSSATSTV